MINHFWEYWLPNQELVFAPRLTAGIYAVARGLDAKRVLLPNNCCPNVVYAVLLARAEPVFCEIDIATGGLNAQACEALMRKTKVDMLIHVHMYGLYSERQKLHELCQSQGVFFFEDGASWFPPIHGYSILNNSCLGLSFGEYKIFSFGAGAVVGFSDSRLAKEVERLLDLSPAKPSAPSDYVANYTSMVRDDGLPKRIGTDFSFLAEQYRDYWIGRSALPKIDLNSTIITEERKRRTRLAKSFKEILAPLNLKFFSDHPLDMPWSFNFISPRAHFFADGLSNMGIPVSRLYPPLNFLFPRFLTSAKLTNSYQLGAQICNFQLSQEIGQEAANRLRLAVRDLSASFVSKGLRFVFQYSSKGYRYIKRRLKSTTVNRRAGSRQCI